MEKRVFVFSRHVFSQMADRVHYELKYIHNTGNTLKADPHTAINLLDSFSKEFNIKTFPCVQIGEKNNTWTTIHMDPDYEEQIQGAGGKQIRDFTYIKVDSIDELIDKALEIYRR